LGKTPSPLKIPVGYVLSISLQNGNAGMRIPGHVNVEDSFGSLATSRVGSAGWFSASTFERIY